ncbi:arginine ABC transporter permease ArtQ, partial [Mesorhizobium sp. M00.F.Ca.ET.158.01.1.1]
MGGFAAQFAAAFMVTVGLALVSGFLGTVFGLLLAISKGTSTARFRSVVTAYTTVVRGV